MVVLAYSIIISKWETDCHKENKTLRAETARVILSEVFKGAFFYLECWENADNWYFCM